jgi:hypothetical protein
MAVSAQPPISELTSLDTDPDGIPTARELSNVGRALKADRSAGFLCRKIRQRLSPTLLAAAVQQASRKAREQVEVEYADQTP